MQTDTDNRTVDDASENTDQQNIRGNRNRRQNICQNTGHQDRQTRIKGKFFPQVPVTDVKRAKIQQTGHQGIRDLPPEKHLARTLNQQSQSRHSARVQSAGPHKRFNVYS